MACEVCEHCHGPVGHNETLTVRDGYSYHEKCHKCFVCSETNLQDAEVFQGVIFCSSCSHRIFRGCSQARRTKNNGRRNTKTRSQKKRSQRTQDRRVDKRHDADGILELTTLAVSTDSSNNSELRQSRMSKFKSSSSKDQTITSRAKKIYGNDKANSMKKSSVEMGMTTDVTQELLKEMNCPVVTEHRMPAQLDKPKTKTEKRKRKAECSDLRIAELGASTEIANMALRNKSELPVIIKSEPRVRNMESLSLSALNQESDESGAQNEWTDSAYSSLRDSTRTHWMDRRLGSILKLPYKAFKKHILDRSSLISVLISSDNDFTLKKRIRGLFQEEITKHQKRGLKRLYSTINRKKTPNKLGWLEVVTNTCSECQNKRSTSSRCHHKRCKHFRNSHSFRCMRAQVMKLAGPTSSELAIFRNKMLDIASPGFIRNFGPDSKKHTAIKMSQACGNSMPGSRKA